MEQVDVIDGQGPISESNGRREELKELMLQGLWKNNPSLVQVLAWLVSAGLLHAAARRQADDKARSIGAMQTLASPLALWAPLLAGLVGWLLVWGQEFNRAALAAKQRNAEEKKASRAERRSSLVARFVPGSSAHRG